MGDETLPSVNEGTSARLRLSFLDPDEALEAPTSGKYWLLDMLSGTVIRDGVAISGIAETVDIWLEPADNAILDDTKEFEVKRVIAEGTYNASDAVRRQFDYLVENLSVIDVAP